jgi:hypothetical protein
MGVVIEICTKYPGVELETGGLMYVITVQCRVDKYPRTTYEYGNHVHTV